MHTGIDLGVLAVFAAGLLLWGLFAARLERADLTAPIAFVLLGLLSAHGPWAFIDVPMRSETVRTTAELTLALVLFADASRVNARAVRGDAAITARLLLIGLPLTIGAGFAAALVCSPGNLWVAAIIGAAVAPTDAALGAVIVTDRRVPARIRRVLNVESGLNDGIATPFVSLFVAGAAASEAVMNESVSGAVKELGVGVATGVVVGIVGALLMRVAVRRGWSASEFRPFVALGLALFTYAFAIQISGNGFVAAFVGGLAFGSTYDLTGEDEVVFTDHFGAFLSLAVWFVFGAAMIVTALEHAEWADVLFAALALTAVRMVPVALSLAGAGLDRPTRWFVGWFGPRGLASVVFALIAYDNLEGTDGQRVLAAVSITVLASVVLHGLSAAPLAKRYGEYAAGLADNDAVHADVPSLRAHPRAGRYRAPARRVTGSGGTSRSDDAPAPDAA